MNEILIRKHNIDRKLVEMKEIDIATQPPSGFTTKPFRRQNLSAISLNLFVSETETETRLSVNKILRVQTLEAHGKVYINDRDDLPAV